MNLTIVHCGDGNLDDMPLCGERGVITGVLDFFTDEDGFVRCKKCIEELKMLIEKCK